MVSLSKSPGSLSSKSLRATADAQNILLVGVRLVFRVQQSKIFKLRYLILLLNVGHLRKRNLVFLLMFEPSEKGSKINGLKTNTKPI